MTEPNDLPVAMRAVKANKPGGPEVLKLGMEPCPRPGENEILIQVAAAGVNRPDLMQREGSYPPPKGVTDILGLEVAGHVAAVGRGIERYRPGEAVMALLTGGGYADYCLAPEAMVLPMPASLSLIEAAAIPETFFTVWSNLFDRAGMIAGESLLIHGGASGIGTAAIQLAKAFGVTVFVTVGSEDKASACRALGADLAIVYREEDFVAKVKEATGGKGVDVILDMVGGDYVDRNWKAAAVEGRIVQIAALNGVSDHVDIRRLMVKRLTHTGSTLRARDAAFKGAIAAALERHVWPLIEDGTIRPVIHQTFALEDAHAAHECLERSAHVGKIVLVTHSVARAS